MKFEDQWF